MAEVIYNCQPIRNFIIGGHEFQDGLLTLSEADAAEFDKFLSTLPPIEQNRIRKIDQEAAVKLVQEKLPAASQSGGDSAEGRAALAALQKKNPLVGVKPVDTPKESAPVADEPGAEGQGAVVPPAA